MPKSGVKRLYEMLPQQRFGPPELCLPDLGPDPALPGVLIGARGKGQVIFVPWQPDALYHEHSLLEHRALIASLAGRGTGVPTVTLNRPGRLG